MNRAFHNGVNGTKSYQFGIDTWANNIANINTYGYRANMPQFANLFSDKIAMINNQGPVQSDQGFGVRANSSAISMKLGSMMPTDRTMDLAIGSEGWFGVIGSDGNTPYFTRNGSFMYNRDGDIVNSDGAYILGSLSDELKSGTLTEVKQYMPLKDVGSQEALKLPKTLTLQSVPTKEVSFRGNLGVEGAPMQFNTHITAPNGDENLLTVDIKQITQEGKAPTWMMQAMVNSSKGENIFTSEAVPLNFKSNGALDNFTPPVIKNGDVEINLKNIELVTLAGDKISKSIVKDGTKQGSLERYHINKAGHIMAEFDNGLSSVVGKLGVYHFQNDQGLEKVGQNQFRPTSNSGEPFFYTNENGDYTIGSQLMPYTIEMSNTSASQALTELIIMQKAFDASAKAITTGDQLIQQALKMV